ncbi:MAG TPA: MFS transporter [Acidimicrobiales bacterium]|jgi:ACDE family multidrug resistance protein|nr:MFS transporter [Acidimicrobiales bacterium]
MRSNNHGAAVSPFRQPKAVWAVAFACVVSFMGIGLVDPILPALSKQLKASPSSVELLFTSYLVVTAVAMLVTGWVSSRIGAKRTLIAGLTLIVVFSALAGSSNTISQIIGFRAGWGLGNALFIATSLAVIIGSASGGFTGAIILYETALGVGIALGPLIGGELGGISWRGPFFGVAVLMAISLVATIAFVTNTPRPPRPTSLLDPIRALRHRGLATMSATALFYNWGFFTLLAYTPFLMHLGIHQLGFVFTGWGVLVAIFAVFAAPRLQRRFGTPKTLYVNLALLAVDLLVIAVYSSSKITLIVAVIVSGAFIGLNNTLTTQAVMLVSPVERPVASAAYGFVRFIGGGLAPYCAAKLAIAFNVQVPFYLGAGTVVIAIGLLATGHRLLTRAEGGAADELVDSLSVEPLSISEGNGIEGISVPESTDHGLQSVVVAVDSSANADAVEDAGIVMAHLADSRVDLLHIFETEIVEEQAIDVETAEVAKQLIAQGVDRIRVAGVPSTGYLLTVVGDHGAAGRRIAEFANDHLSRLIVIGRADEGSAASVFDADLVDQVLKHAQCDVHIVRIPPVHIGGEANAPLLTHRA